MSLTNVPPIRVMLLLSGLSMGGAERQALLLATHGHLSNLDCMLVSVLSPDAPVLAANAGNVLQNAEQLGIRAVSLNARRIFSVHALIQFYNLVHAEKPDVVYTFGFRADLVSRFLTGFAGCPLLLNSIRSAKPSRHPAGLIFDRWTSRFVNAWISNSHAGKKRFVEQEHLPAHKVFVVANGIEICEPIDSTPSEAPVRRTWGIRPDELVIGTVGTLRGAKGYDDLITSVPYVIQAVPNARFVIVGEGALRGALEERIRSLQLEQVVLLAGHSDRVFEALSGMDLFVLPSHYEGMPNALMEAMMAEKPCVATTVGDNSLIVDQGQCGVLVSPKQPEELAQALIALAQDAARAKRLAAAARQKVLTHYAPKKMVDGVRAVIDSLRDK